MAQATRNLFEYSGICWLLALCWLLGETKLSGCPEEPAAQQVQVSVVAILASETSKRVDPRVECIAREVRKIHPHLTGFRPATMVCKSIPVKGSEKFDLVVDQSAAVTVLKAADAMNRVQLKVTPPTLGEITYTTTCGKFFPILTRYQTQKGEWLIIAVRVQPCQGQGKAREGGK